MTVQWDLVPVAVVVFTLMAWYRLAKRARVRHRAEARGLMARADAQLATGCTACACGHDSSVHMRNTLNGEEICLLCIGCHHYVPI